jgi:hypothetical protein
MMSQTFWAILVLVAALAFGASSLLFPDFGGFEPGRFPVPQEDPPVQPAGYAFAIWGLIFLWLIASALYGLIARRDADDWADMRPALVLSLGVGATWLAVAKATPVGALVLIWVMLIPALIALFRAPLLDRWWARAPIGIYAGWLSAASFVALGLNLAGFGIMNAVPAALLCLVLAILLAAVVQVALAGVPEYGLTVVWALIAVIVANIPGPGIVVIVAAAGIALLGLLSVRAMTQPRA